MRGSALVAPVARGRLMLVLLAAFFLLPMVAALALYVTGWRSAGTNNYGDLVQPARTITDAPLHTLHGDGTRFIGLRGKWNLIYFGPAACARPCRANLRKMRQITLAQGQEARRVRRVFVVTPGAALDGLHRLRREYPDMQVIVGPPENIGQLARQFAVPAGTPLDGLNRVYLVDPLGNFVLSYPADANPDGMRKDLAHLLKVSQIG